MKLSGLNRFPLAISLPRCASPYQEAIPVGGARFAAAGPVPARNSNAHNRTVFIGTIRY